MRMKPEHFNHLKAEIEKTLKTYGVDQLINKYETGDFIRSEKVIDLQTRFNWDLVHATKGLNSWICNELYDEPNNLHDSHISTALKKICPKVTRKY
jgi:hypothetical protein